MRIMYCLPEMSHPGGIARVTSLKANWLVEHGHEVYIVTTDQKGEDVFYELNDSIMQKDLNIDFRSYESDNVIKKYYKRRKLIALFEQRLKTIVEEWQPEIMVSTFNNESEFLYKWLDGSKKVLEFHYCHEMNNNIIKYGNVSNIKAFVLKLKDRQREFIAKKYDAFVVLTKEDAEDWKKISSYDNLHVIPNMLSFESSKKSNCESKRVIAVGRLDLQKKFDRLIDIWNIVNKHFPDWHLDIFGQGDDKTELLDKIKDLNLGNVIEIHEPSSSIADEYAKSSILAMTSVYEGWGLVLTEAMSVGIPCIAFACKCGPRDIISNDVDGFCITGETNEFCEKLKTIMRDDVKRKEMGNNARINSKKYSLDAIMKKWVKLFTELNKRK